VHGLLHSLRNFGASLINITNYEVHQFGAWLQGDLNARLHASLVSVHEQLHPSDHTQVISNVPYQLPEISLPTFTFPVLAIPVTVHPILQNELGFDIGIRQLNSPSIGLRANVDGALRLGVMYNGDSGWGAINDKSWEHSLDFVGPAVQTSVSFTPYIMPKVVFVIEHIGGPSFGVKIGLEAQLTWDAMSSTCPLLPRPAELPAAVPTGGAFGKLDLTFQFSLGAELKIEFFSRTLM